MWGMVALILVAVVAGMVLLWPDESPSSIGPESRLPDTERARVVDTDRVECQVPSSSQCLEVTVKLLTGPDSGDESSFIAGDADDESAPTKGDVLRVVKSDVPEGSQIGGVEVPAYSISDYERRMPLYWLVGLFVVVVLVTGREPVDAIARALEGKLRQLFTIGDALSARMLAAAVYEGHKFARAIGEADAPGTTSEAWFRADPQELLPFPADVPRPT